MANPRRLLGGFLSECVCAEETWSVGSDLILFGFVGLDRKKKSNHPCASDGIRVSVKTLKYLKSFEEICADARRILTRHTPKNPS